MLSVGNSAGFSIPISGSSVACVSGGFEVVICFGGSLDVVDFAVVVVDVWSGFCLLSEPEFVLSSTISSLK